MGEIELNEIAFKQGDFDILCKLCKEICVYTRDFNILKLQATYLDFAEYDFTKIANEFLPEENVKSLIKVTMDILDVTLNPADELYKGFKADNSLDALINKAYIYSNLLRLVLNSVIREYQDSKSKVENK